MTQEDSFKQKKIIEELIEMNFKELPEIITMSGCIKYSENARRVLKEMIKNKK